MKSRYIVRPVTNFEDPENKSVTDIRPITDELRAKLIKRAEKDRDDVGVRLIQRCTVYRLVKKSNGESFIQFGVPQGTSRRLPDV